MITLTRRQARCLRGVFRRHALGITGKGPVPPLVLRSEGSQLRAQHRYAGLAVEHALDADARGPGPVALPLDALADFEGKDDSPVAVVAVSPDRTVVRWADRGIPQTREYAVPALDTLAAFPDPPASWSECPAGLLDALAEATATGADDSTRYALNCLQLRGAAGEVVATDGRQLLVQGGFVFPWDGDVLVRRSPAFANKALPRDRPVSVGKTDTHVVLRAGPWTVFCEVQDARFPRVDQVIPDATAAATRLRLDPGDAAFLGQALDRLPGADVLNSPATLDLNGRVAVRARGADQAQATELVLARSGFTGAPVRVNANRAFLARAVRLGFTEVEVVDADSPVVLRDRGRVYCFQPLSKESAIEPTDDVIRIDSAQATPAPGRRTRPGTPKARSSVSERTTPERTGRKTARPQSPPPLRVGRRRPPRPAGLVALIQEAEALHEALADARARAGRLTVALRKHRRRERLVNTTLASLKALKLQDVAG